MTVGKAMLLNLYVLKQTLPGIQIFSPVPPALPTPPHPAHFCKPPKPQATRGESKKRPGIGGGAGAAYQSRGKRGRRQKRAAVGGLGVGGGGNLETTPAGMGSSGYSRVGTAIATVPEVFFEKPNCWRRPERWKPQGGKRTREAPAAEQEAGTKEADSRRQRLPMPGEWHGPRPC